MTEADVQRLLASEKIRRVAPDPEMARAEIGVAYVAECRTMSGPRLVWSDLRILGRTVKVMAKGEGLQF